MLCAEQIMSVRPLKHSHIYHCLLDLSHVQCSLDLIRPCSSNNTLLSASCTQALLADAALCLTDDRTVYNRWAAVPTYAALYGGLLHTPNISTKTLL